MTDIVIFSAGPSRFTQTESASLEKKTSASSTTTPTYAAHVNSTAAIFSHHPVTSDTCQVYSRRVPNEVSSTTIRIEDLRTPTESAMQSAVSPRNPSATHPIRFHNAREMFQAFNKESTQTYLPLVVNKETIHQYRPNEGSISHLTVDQFDNRVRDIPVQTISRPNQPSASSTAHDDDRVQRKSASSEQHYDFPVDLIEQWRNHQHVDRSATQTRSKVAEPPMVTRLIPAIVPSNVLKRMDHLNTIFIKPTQIAQPLPKLFFQENETEECSTKDEQSKSIDTTNFDGKQDFHYFLLLDSHFPNDLREPSNRPLSQSSWESSLPMIDRCCDNRRNNTCVPSSDVISSDHLHVPSLVDTNDREPWTLTASRQSPIRRKEC